MPPPSRVPVTNDGDLLQVSPLESLTSLTRAPPGRAARGAPDRYYPTGRRTFLRLVPNDLRVADLITARVSELDAERVALVTGEGVYAEELTSQVAERLRRDGRTVVPTDVIDDDPKAPRSLVEQLTEQAPDAIVYAGLGDRQAVRLLSALARSLPATPVLTGAGVLDRAPLRFGAAPARVEAFGPLAAGGELRGRRAADPRGVAARRPRVAARGALRLRGRAPGARRRAPGRRQARRGGERGLAPRPAQVADRALSRSTARGT